MDTNSKNYCIYSLVFAEIALGSTPTFYFKLMCVCTYVYINMCVGGVSELFQFLSYGLYIFHSHSLINHFQTSELV